MTDVMWAIYGIKVVLLIGVVMLVAWGGRAVRWIRVPARAFFANLLIAPRRDAHSTIFHDVKAKARSGKAWIMQRR